MEKALQNRMLFEVGAFSAETGPPGIRARSPCLASVCRSSTTEAIFARLRKAKGGMPPPEMLFTTIVFRSASLASRHWTPRQFREFDLRSLRRVHNIRRNLP